MQNGKKIAKSHWQINPESQFHCAFFKRMILFLDLISLNVATGFSQKLRQMMFLMCFLLNRSYNRYISLFTDFASYEIEINSALKGFSVN